MEATAQQRRAHPGATALEAVGYHVQEFLSVAAELAGAANSHGETDAASPAGADDPWGVDLGALSDSKAVSWAQDLEAVSRVLSALQVQVAGELAERVRDKRFAVSGVNKPVTLLVSALRLSAAEAYRRLELAEGLLPVIDSLTGQLQAPQHPILGQAFFGGEISVEQALIASKFADEASHLAAGNRISRQEAQNVENTLARYAVEETPDFLRRIGQRVLNNLDPEGMQPTEGQLIAKQGIHFRKPRRGLVHVDGHLTVSQYESVMSGIGWATNPSNPSNPAGSGDKRVEGQGLESRDSENRESARERGVKIPAAGSGEELQGLSSLDPQATDPSTEDSRTYAQKLLDGLIHCVLIAAGSGTLSHNGGLRPQLFITTTQADLERRAARHYGNDGRSSRDADWQEELGSFAFLPYSGPQPLGLFDQDLCDAEVTRIMMGEGQNIVGVGRSQRLFTTAQRKILLARDLGCTFPDCTAPPQWCEAHHVIPWQLGGLTDLNNAALLCKHHHTLIHTSTWQLSLVQGTPTFTPPYILDPQQRPRHNNFHHARLEVPPG